MLAAKIVQEQGIKIVPLKFNTPFYSVNIRTYHGRSLADFIKFHLKEELITVDIDKEFLRLLLKPQYGFGSHMNPCIDCKILMFSKARALMPRLKAGFVVTGEVLGQRPMSQHRRALYTIESNSGLDGLLLRPLCAKNLKPTIPEENGWVDRARLLGISGRSRSQQIKLAREFGMEGYPNASGGCLLTDRQFSLRINDLIRHGEFKLNNVRLLKFGRHFRISPHAKLIVGRNEKENKYLEDLAKPGDYIFNPEEKVAGPTCLGLGRLGTKEILLCARIACSYSDLLEDKLTIVYRRLPNRKKQYLDVFSFRKESLAKLLV